MAADSPTDVPAERVVGFVTGLLMVVRQKSTTKHYVLSNLQNCHRYKHVLDRAAKTYLEERG